jgi:hypothetical protein
MRQTSIRPHRPHIFSLTLAAALALAFCAACSGSSGETHAVSSPNAGNGDTVTTAGAHTAASNTSGTTTTTAAAATNPYDAAMIKLTQAGGYHFVMTTDVKAGGDASKPSHSVADGVYAQSNKAMQFKLESDAEYSDPGEWIVIGNGKKAYHKVGGAWTDKGFITPPGVGFNLQAMLTAITLRNATDPAGNAPPAPLGSENIDGQDCDHYHVKLPEQTYDVYLNKTSGDVVRAELTRSNTKQTLSISHLNEPVTIAPPI